MSDEKREPDLVEVMFACAFLILSFITAVWAIETAVGR